MKNGLLKLSIYIFEKMLKWFNSAILFRDKYYIKNGVEFSVKKLVIINFIVLGGRLKEIVTVKFNDIMVMVEMFNGFSIKFVGVKFVIEFMGVKSVGEPGRNLEISILGGNILFSFKNLLLKSVEL